MKDEEKYYSYSDGTFTLEETDDANVMYFFRNDKGVLKNITNEPIRLYQFYIMHKMIKNNYYDTFISNFKLIMSSDNKVIKLVAYSNRKERNSSGCKHKYKYKYKYKQKKNFFKRLFRK